MWAKDGKWFYLLVSGGVMPGAMMESYGGVNPVIVMMGALALAAYVYWFEKCSDAPKRDWMVIQSSWMVPLLLWFFGYKYNLVIHDRGLQGVIPPATFLYMAAFQLAQSVFVSGYLLIRSVKN